MCANIVQFFCLSRTEQIIILRDQQRANCAERCFGPLHKATDCREFRWRTAFSCPGSVVFEFSSQCKAHYSGARHMLTRYEPFFLVLVFFFSSFLFFSFVFFSHFSSFLWGTPCCPGTVVSQFPPQCKTHYIGTGCMLTRYELLYFFLFLFFSLFLWFGCHILAMGRFYCDKEQLQGLWYLSFHPNAKHTIFILEQGACLQGECSF